MSSLKPIIVYCHPTGPNPKKTVILLEELGLPYNARPVAMPDLKKAPYTLLNPNGRAPTIEDPNTGVKLWETGAIAMYLVEKYDKTEKLHHETEPERYQEWQWTAFQISGQGPYYGQAIWFSRFHPEKVPSAVERYKKEIERVTGVLDGWLKDHSWLVGDKCTYADLMFVPWCLVAQSLDKGKSMDLEERYPNYSQWLKSMTERDGVKRAIAVMDKMAAEYGAKH